MSNKILRCRLLPVMVLLIACSCCFAEKRVYSPTDDTFADQWAPNAIRGSESYGYLLLRNTSGYNLQSLLKF